jgi:hypothetical protein
MMRSVHEDVRQPALGGRRQPPKGEAKQAMPEMRRTLIYNDRRYREVQREPDADYF